MVQIFQAPESKKNKFFTGLVQGLEGLPDLLERFGEDKALARKGIDLHGISNPETRKTLINKSVEGQPTLQDVKNKQTLAKYIGQEGADFYYTLNQEARGDFMQGLFDNVNRGKSVQNYIEKFKANGGVPGGGGRPATPEGLDIEEYIPPKTGKELPKDLKLPDFTNPPVGYTSKEWRDEKKTWRKDNYDLYSEASKQLDARDRDMLGVENLQRLNDTRKIGEGFSSLLINPQTGEFYGLAQLTGAVPKEAQEWGKEIARFGNRAKDAFGSRVTNFDLQQYMKQFPGLLNTFEGRKRILEMMKINYELDELFDSTLKQVYESAKLNNIPPEEARRITEELVKEQKDKLKRKYLMLDQENMNEEFSSSGENKNRKSLEEIFG